MPSSALNKRKWGGPSGQLPKPEDDEERVEPDLGGPKRARVEDVNEEHDTVAQDEEDYYVDEDEEGGRFFGGGLSDKQKHILQIMNRDGEEQVEEAVRVVPDTDSDGRKHARRYTQTSATARESFEPKSKDAS